MSQAAAVVDRPTLSREDLLAGGEPLLRVRLGPDGLPAGASAMARLSAPPARVWAIITDVERYAGRIPMIGRARRDGDRVTLDLRFKLPLFSVGFQFVAEVRREEGRLLELAWVSGEPRGLRLRYELWPAAGGAGTIVETDAEFDVMSLGWLAKYFLKHHPEIQYGIFPGVTLSLIDSLRKAL